MLCSTPVDQSRSRQASFSYTAHHLAVYEKRQVTQNLFIPSQCQGGSGKRKCSFTMSRLNFRDLIEQLLSSIFRPVTKREILLNTVSLFFTIKYLGGGMAFMVVLRNFSECNGLKFYIPEISQNSCYHKISWACKKYHSVWASQRIFSWIKSCKSLNIMVPGAGGGDKPR